MLYLLYGNQKARLLTTKTKITKPAIFMSQMLYIKQDNKVTGQCVLFTLLSHHLFFFFVLITTWNSLIHVLSYLLIICLIPTRISFPWEQGSRKFYYEKGKSLDGHINEYVLIMMDKRRALLSKKIKILVGRGNMSLSNDTKWQSVLNNTEYYKIQWENSSKTDTCRENFWP